MSFDKNALMKPKAPRAFGNPSIPVVPNWQYYFDYIEQVPRGSQDDITFEMNKALAEVGILCDFRPGVFGIMKDNMNASSFLPLSGRYYFSEKSYADGYLAAAIAAGQAKAGRDFVFHITF